jgi:hypothetical protein
MWVDYDVPNWFLTSKNFYQSPFSKWSPQYRTNSTLSDFNECWIFAVLWWPFWKWWPVENFSMSGNNSGHHYLPTYQILMIPDNVEFLPPIIWYSARSPLEEQFCVFKIFKMSSIFKMAAKTRHKKWAVEIQHCPVSSKFDMWVDNDVPNCFPTLKNFMIII